MADVRETRSMIPVIAAAAWVVVPIAWLVAAGFDDGAGSAFTPFYSLGWIALIGAGVLMFVAMLSAQRSAGNRPLLRAGLVIHALGVLTTVVFFWAVPLWAGLYAVAAVLYAIAMPWVRGPWLVVAASMAAGVASLFVLTALQVGTPDPVYGDYPIAWATSYTVSALGAAAGSFLLWRHGSFVRRSTHGTVSASG